MNNASLLVSAVIEYAVWLPLRVFERLARFARSAGFLMALGEASRPFAASLVSSSLQKYLRLFIASQRASWFSAQR